MLRATCNAAVVSEKLELCKTLVESLPQSMFLLDKDKYIIGIYNVNANTMAGINVDDIVGKHISNYTGDPSSPFYQACTMLDDAFDKVFESGEPINFEYNILDTHFEAWISKISGGRILSQVRNITGVVTRFQESERKTYEQVSLLNKQNKLILDNIQSVLVYMTPDFMVKWSNIATIFKNMPENEYYKPGDYCYQSLNRDSPCENCVMQQSLISHKSESVEIANEQGMSMEVTANPILGSNDTVEGVVLKIDNITQRKKIVSDLEKAEQEASSTNQLLYTILDNLPASIFVKDANDDYKYIVVNREFCHNFGLSEKESVGKTDYEIFPTKEEADKYRADDMDTIENNKTKIIREEMVTMKDGVIVCHTIKTPLINVDNNNQKLLVGIGLDITERHNAYQQLDVARKKAEESDKLKSAFLANMSHEIRTPLNAIVGFSELMLTCDDESEKQDYMRIIATNNELLLRLINDILDLSKLESGVTQLQNTEFDLAQYFEELSATMRQHINNPSIEFIAVNPYASCIVKTDKIRIAQVWHNFMTNAIKYTVSGYIKMGYEYVNNGIRLYVEDTGIGIADEKKNKLFQRFEKLDSFAQGTGLGLSICKAISELDGGNVGFESTQGKGSLFWSWKPMEATIVAKSAQEPASSDVELSSKSHVPVDVCGLSGGPVLRILVAEDNDSNYMLISYILRRNFELLRADNGQQAVDIVRSGGVDLVLMDMRMPVMGGLEAVCKIREFNLDIPIIALTANAFDADKQDALNAGCNDFVAKPVRKEELMGAIENAIKEINS